MARNAKMGALKDLADMLLPDLLEDFDEEKKKKKKEFEEKEDSEVFESEKDESIPFKKIESTEIKQRIVNFSLSNIMASRPSHKKGKRSKKS